MSFSSDVKKEVSQINNLSNKKAVKAEFIGYLISKNIDIIDSKNIKFSTESEYNINRFAKLLNNLGQVNYSIDIQGRTFNITNPFLELDEVDFNENGIKLNIKKIEEFFYEDNNNILKKALIRGTFLGSGSINNPENKYHLEIIFYLKHNMDYIFELIKKCKVECKILNKCSEYSIYIKDSEEISKFLALIGGNLSVLKFEDIRVIRNMRNNVNRKVNCETANLNKTVNAAVLQIEAINIIKQYGEFEKLSENLKEIAKLRLEHTEASLVELGNMLKNPIGKSGVNHRLKAIIEIAEEIKKSKRN